MSITGNAQKVAYKIQQNKYLKAVTNGLMGILPILMIGSIALLIAVFPIQAWKDFLTNIGVRPYLMAASTLTTSCMALYAVFLIGYRLAIEFDEDGIPAGLISLFSFLIVTPLPAIEGGSYLNIDWLGAKGLFTGMLVALLATRIYVFFKKKGLTIQMPDGVPPVISNTFAGLFPAMIAGGTFIAVAVIFSFTSFGSLASLIYEIVAAPLQNLSNNVFSLLVLVLMQMVLWFFGIHGSLVIQAFVNSLYMPLDALQMEAVAAGVANSELPYILGKTFYSIFSGIGGAGGTLSLCMLLVFFCKAKKHKALGKLAIVPGCFTINEPVVFGMPLVLNPVLAIPFITVPLVQTVIAYAATAIGLVPRLNGVQVPFGTPIFINGFIAGGWRVAVLQAVLIAIGFVMYIPFMKKADALALEEENAAGAKS